MQLVLDKLPLVLSLYLQWLENFSTSIRLHIIVFRKILQISDLFFLDSNILRICRVSNMTKCHLIVVICPFSQMTITCFFKSTGELIFRPIILLLYLLQNIKPALKMTFLILNWKRCIAIYIWFQIFLITFNIMI